MVRAGRHSPPLGSLPPPPAGYSLSPSLLFPGSFSPSKSSFRFSQDRTKKGFEVPKSTRQHPDLPPFLPPPPKSQHLPHFFSSYKHPLSITLARTTVQPSTTSCSLQSTALKWFRAPPRKAGGKVSGVSEPVFAADTYLAVVGAVRGASGAELAPSCCRYHATSAVVHMVPARGREALLGSDGFFPPVAALQGLVEQELCTRLCLACDEANVAKSP